VYVCVSEFVCMCVCVCACVRPSHIMQQFNNPILKSVHFYTCSVPPGHCIREIRVFVHCEDEVTTKWKKISFQEYHVALLIGLQK